MKSNAEKPDPGAIVSEGLRADFICETATAMAGHLAAFESYVWAGNYEAARQIWSCVRLCGRSIGQTLDELEKGRADD